MAEPRSYDWKENLGREEGISRLIRALALSNRFHVYLLMCDTPRIAQAVFDLLPARIAEEREESVRIVRLDPYEKRLDSREPIAFECLAESVLGRLVSPAAEEREEDVIFVVDGSNVLPQDDEAWAVLFQRMNERRNVIAGALRGALVVCLPRRLEPVFAHAAPDFWSIRSLAVVVEGAPPREGGMLEVREKVPTLLYRKVAADDAGEAAKIEHGLATARASLVKAPDEPAALLSLKIWLDRRVEFEINRGSPGRALHAAKERIALVERQLKHEPDRMDWLHDLAASLHKSGRIYESLGKLTLAYDAYDESLRIQRYLLKREPDRTERLRDISVTLNKIGHVHEARREPTLAHKIYDESVRVMRGLLAREPNRVDWLYDLSVSLDDLGDVYKTRGELTLAYKYYDESLQIRQRLLDREPDSTKWLHSLSVSLDKVGCVDRDRGDLAHAYQACDRSIQIMRALLEREPERAEWVRDLSLSLENLGDLHIERGDLVAAQRVYDESLRARRSLLEHYPMRHELRHDVILSIVRQAHLANAKGRLDEALSIWRDVFAKLKSLTRYGNPLPKWLEQVDTARKEIARLESLVPAKSKRRKKKR